MALFTPEWAALFNRERLTKRDVKRLLYERAVIEIERLQPRMIEETKRRGREGTGTFVPVLHVARDPNEILIVVTGGPGVKQTYFPNWAALSAPVTIPI